MLDGLQIILRFCTQILHMTFFYKTLNSHSFWASIYSSFVCCYFLFNAHCLFFVSIIFLTSSQNHFDQNYSKSDTINPLYNHTHFSHILVFSHIFW
jgi:hypothetical protein